MSGEAGARDERVAERDRPELSGEAGARDERVAERDHPELSGETGARDERVAERDHPELSGETGARDERVAERDRPELSGDHAGTSATVDVTAPRRRRRSGVTFWLSAAFLVLVIGCALLAPWVAPHDPTEADLGASLQGISGTHWLGADQSGQDIASRLMYGARTGLLGPLLILGFALVLGPPIGILAAWKGGWVDTVISRATDAGIAFPALLFAVLVIAVFGEGIAAAVIALGLAYTPAVAKLARSAALSESRREYVEAYRVLGVGGASICLRRLVPRVIPLILGYCVVLFGEALMSMAGLSYLGLGAQPPASDWGLMVSEGQLPLIQGALLPSLVPGAAIALTVVAFNVVGVRMADRLGAGR